MTPELVTGAARAAYAAEAAAAYRRLDVLRVPRLTAEAARSAVAFDMHARAAQRLVVIDLDGASEAAQHILLKTLEEPHARFVLVAGQLPLLTVVSRCRRSHMPAASPPPGEAEVAAAAKVAIVLRAVHNRDSGVLARVLRNWDDGHPEHKAQDGACAHALLATWAAQCSSGRFRPPLAMPAGASFPPGFGRRLGRELARYGTARPKLAAQVALADMVSRSV